eukprot:scaffold11884_cov106-Isochrysis_galbana.AAC.8
MQDYFGQRRLRRLRRQPPFPPRVERAGRPAHHDRVSFAWHHHRRLVTRRAVPSQDRRRRLGLPPPHARGRVRHGAGGRDTPHPATAPQGSGSRTGASGRPRKQTGLPPARRTWAHRRWRGCRCRGAAAHGAGVGRACEAVGLARGSRQGGPAGLAVGRRAAGGWGQGAAEQAGAAQDRHRG